MRAGESVLLNEGKGKIIDGVWTSVSGGNKCGGAADFNGMASRIWRCSPRMDC